METPQVSDHYCGKRAVAQIATRNLMGEPWQIS